MTLPLCLEPISQLAFAHGWKLDKVPYGCPLDYDAEQARAVLAAPADNGAYCLKRYHTEASDATAAELAAGVREALATAGTRARREKRQAEQRGARRSSRKRT